MAKNSEALAARIQTLLTGQLHQPNGEELKAKLDEMARLRAQLNELQELAATARSPIVSAAPYDEVRDEDDQSTTSYEEEEADEDDNDDDPELSGTESDVTDTSIKSSPRRLVQGSDVSDSVSEYSEGSTDEANIRTRELVLQPVQGEVRDASELLMRRLAELEQSLNQMATKVADQQLQLDAQQQAIILLSRIQAAHDEFIRRHLQRDVKREQIESDVLLSGYDRAFQDALHGIFAAIQVTSTDYVALQIAGPAGNFTTVLELLSRYGGDVPFLSMAVETLQDVITHFADKSLRELFDHFEQLKPSTRFTRLVTDLSYHLVGNKENDIRAATQAIIDTNTLKGRIVAATKIVRQKLTYQKKESPQAAMGSADAEVVIAYILAGMLAAQRDDDIVNELAKICISGQAPVVVADIMGQCTQQYEGYTATLPAKNGTMGPESVYKNGVCRTLAALRCAAGAALALPKEADLTHAEGLLAGLVRSLHREPHTAQLHKFAVLDQNGVIDDIVRHLTAKTEYRDALASDLATTGRGLPSRMPCLRVDNAGLAGYYPLLKILLLPQGTFPYAAAAKTGVCDALAVACKILERDPPTTDISGFITSILGDCTRLPALTPFAAMQRSLVSWVESMHVGPRQSQATGITRRR
jgi:hypothetical protein